MIRSWHVVPLTLFLVFALLPAVASADFLDLQVAPAESRLELASGEIDLTLAPGWSVLLPIQPQAGEPGTTPGTLPGGGQSNGLETSLAGAVLAEIDAAPTQLDLHPTGTEFSADDSGTWAPASGGGSGVGLADAAFLVEDALLGIDFAGALRGVEGSLEGSLALTPDGPDAWTAAGNIDLHLSEGVLDFDSAIPGLSGSGPLATGGPAIASATVTGGRYEIVNGVGRLSLPFTTDPFVLFASDVGGAVPLSFTATLEGTVVAYLPEPGMGTGLLFGVGALSALSRRRRSRDRRRSRRPLTPRERTTLQCGVLALLLLGLLEAACSDPRTIIESNCDNTDLVSSYDTFQDNLQCGTVEVDTDGAAPPEGSDAGCATPGDDSAPGVLASTTTPAPGGDAIVEASVTRTDEVTQVVCSHDLAAALGPGATQCTAETRRSMTTDIDPSVPVGTQLYFYVSARTLVLGPGAADPFAAGVSVDCPGEAPQTVPLTGESTAIGFQHTGMSPVVCEVVGSITQSSTAAAGQTAHQLTFEIGQCPTNGSCSLDRDCPLGSNCVGSQCSDGSAGASCLVASDCDASAPICYTDGTCRAGILGSACEVDRHCASGLVCTAGSCVDPNPPGSITIDSHTVTPDLNRVGGVYPRYTPSIDLTAVVETSEPMGLLTATTLACDPAKVSSCTPVSDAPSPPTTAWAVDLPDYQGAPSGEPYQIDVAVEDALGAPAATSEQVDFEVYPEDGGSITCTKSYDPGSGALSLGFTVNPPAPATPGQVFQANYYLYQRYDAQGWAQDESDSFRGNFLLTNPTTLTPVDDGEYQIIFNGQIDFVTPFQTSLRIDTLGGPNDVCTLVP